MKEQIEENVKEERSKKIIELSNFTEQEYLNKYVGKKIEILFEEEKNGFWKGHSKNYIMVKVESNKNLKNLILEPEIVTLENLELIGNIN